MAVMVVAGPSAEIRLGAQKILWPPMAYPSLFSCRSPRAGRFGAACLQPASCIAARLWVRIGHNYLWSGLLIHQIGLLQVVAVLVD